MTSFEVLIMTLADWTAYAGVLVVMLGVIFTLAKLVIYIVTGFDEYQAASMRHFFMIYLSIGLDFIIAKDVILVLTIETGDLNAILQIAIIIGVRFLLSFFVHLEERSLHRQGLKLKPKQSSLKLMAKKKRK